jgi:protein tyrosine phosphatase (PTP) superfamily phosphohydrolase (DUF442 family)
VLFATFGACSRPTEPEASPAPAVDAVHNLHALGSDLWSGAVPEGDEAFRSLRDLGIRTIISVDGTRPDVERARKFGLRYVHIPIGYGGIQADQAVRLGRAANELPGPIFVHCHHGQHRGPAVAALMRRCRPDGWTADEAVAFLKTAGTDQKYEGLYASVRIGPPSIAGKNVTETFPEVVEVGGLTARMVEIDEIWDAIKRIKAKDWQAVSGASESPAHLALRLNEQFREAARLPDAPKRPESFRKTLADAERAASELESALRASDVAAAGKAFERSAALCSSCHREHRDRKRP